MWNIVSIFYDYHINKIYECIINIFEHQYIDNNDGDDDLMINTCGL